jgi:ABC-type ATPase involved in cell division
MLKVFHLKEKKVKLFERSIGINYNMEYLKLMALEAQDIITNVECRLQVSNDKIELLEKKVCEFFWV